MGCTACGENTPKHTAKDFTKAVIEINNPEQLILFRKVIIPASMGDDKTVPPVVGKYSNVLLVYEANNHAYLYSSDGIPTLLASDVAQDIEEKIEELRGELQEETLGRESADTRIEASVSGLTDALATETTNRVNADTALDGRLTTVEGVAATALQPSAIDKVVMTDISLNPNTSTTTVQIDGAKENLLTGATTTKNLPLPVASHTEAGVMNSSTFDAVTNNSNNINALLNGAVAITGLSANPSQSDLTTAWEAETGLTTLMNRAGIYDVTNNKVWTYYSNDDTWYAASNTSQVTINTFTNNSEGTIKGSTNVGQIFAENDGTGSVNGWDALSGNVSTNTSNIASLQTTVAGKQDKLTAGDNITISPTNVISAASVEYTAGNGITIDTSDNNRIDAAIYPEDFFTASETIEGEGSDFTLDDTLPAKIDNVQLKGNTYQQTYSGKNLLPSSGLSANTINGVTITPTYNTNNELLYITLNGTATGNVGYTIGYVTFESGKTYTASGVTGGSTSTYRVWVNSNAAFPVGNRLYTQDGARTATAAADESDVQVYIQLFSGATLDNVVIYPQIELGSTATDYEPYVGGVPAPNPEYPQDVQTVTGEQTVRLSGKNLWKPAPDGTSTQGGITSVRENGTITLTGTSTATSTGTSPFYDLDTPLPAGTYTFSIKNALPYRLEFVMQDSNGTNHFPAIAVGSRSGTITTTWETVKIRNGIGGYTVGTEINLTIEKLQLEQGSTATDFEPYQSQSYTIDLGSTELCKIGDYQDYIYKSGDDWYVHKEIGKYTFTGAENFYADAYGTGSWRIDNLIEVYGYSEDKIVVISDIAKGIPYANRASMDSTMTSACYYYNVNARLYFRNAQQSTQADMQSAVMGKSIYYLSTPTDTQITDAGLIAELDALGEARTYLDTTHFLTTATGINLPVILDIEAARKSLDGVIASIKEPTTPNDATLTIQQNGTSVATFTANSSTDVTANITSPTFTMTDNDPGEGATIGDNELIGVYGGDPIILDYSTNEVNTGIKWIDGATIYKKTINTGALPNATTVNIAHNISDLGTIVKLEAMAYDSSASTWITMPYVVSSGGATMVSIRVVGPNITVATGNDRSNFTSSYTTLYYTKTS